MIGSGIGVIDVQGIIDVGSQVIAKFFSLVREDGMRDAEKIDPIQDSVSDRRGRFVGDGR